MAKVCKSISRLLWTRRRCLSEMNGHSCWGWVRVGRQAGRMRRMRRVPDYTVGHPLSKTGNRGTDGWMDGGSGGACNAISRLASPRLSWWKKRKRNSRRGRTKISLLSFFSQNTSRSLTYIYLYFQLKLQWLLSRFYLQRKVTVY